MPADQHRRTLSGQRRIQAVTIADRKDADPGILLRNDGSAVSDGLARAAFPDIGQEGPEGKSLPDFPGGLNRIVQIKPPSERITRATTSSISV